MLVVTWGWRFVQRWWEVVALDLLTVLTGHFHIAVCCFCNWIWHEIFFLLWWCWGKSILWWHRRLIWAAWGSPDTCLMCHTIAFELSRFLPVALLCLQGTFLNQCCHHWWFLIQILCLREKTRICPCVVFWLSQRGISLSSLEPVLHYTTHLHCRYPGRNWSEGRIWL